MYIKVTHATRAHQRRTATSGTAAVAAAGAHAPSRPPPGPAWKAKKSAYGVFILPLRAYKYMLELFNGS